MKIKAIDMDALLDILRDLIIESFDDGELELPKDVEDASELGIDRIYLEKDGIYASLKKNS